MTSSIGYRANPPSLHFPPPSKPPVPPIAPTSGGQALTNINGGLSNVHTYIIVAAVSSVVTAFFCLLLGCLSYRRLQRYYEQEKYSPATIMSATQEFDINADDEQQQKVSFRMSMLRGAPAPPPPPPPLQSFDEQSFSTGTTKVPREISFGDAALI